MGLSKNYKGTTLVYVVSRKGKPLMPTRNTRKVSKFLKQHKVVPICNNPFTIRLNYDTTDGVQPLTLGIDTGRENIGASVTTESGKAVYFEELQTNNKNIKKSMETRKQSRNLRHRHKRQRNQRKALRTGTEIKAGNNAELHHKTRYSFKSKMISYPGMEKAIEHKIIKGAEARFNNRKQPKGWLTPSGNQLIQMHKNLIYRISKILPITSIVLERVSFDFQKLENENIEAWEYSKGTLYGYNTYKEFISEQQQGRCLLCNEHQIDEYHHIKPRSQRGSNTPKNIAGLCTDCHDKVHKSIIYQGILEELKEGLKTKYSISLLNSVMPRLIEEVTEYCNKSGISLTITDGYETKCKREELKLPKRHCLDAYIISIHGKQVSKPLTSTTTIYHSRRYKKKSKNIIKQYGDREYEICLPSGEQFKVYNRHKKTGQTLDSLEEAINEYESGIHQCITNITSCTHTYTYLRQKYRPKSNFHAGDIVQYTKQTKSKGITSQGVYTVTSVKNSVNSLKLIDNTLMKKSVNKKFCRRFQSRGCIPIVSKEVIGRK